MTERYELRGAGIGRRLAVGPVRRMADPLPPPEDLPTTIGQAQERENAVAAIAATVELLLSRAASATGQAKDVLEAQALIAEDPTLDDDIATMILAGKTAERAVFEAFARFRDVLLGLGGYMAERASDLDDISQRVIAKLRGVASPGIPDSDHPFVLVAHDLAPADTALLDLSKVLALITREGGPTSHTAILSREKSIVAVVGVAGATDLRDDEMVIVDGATGVVTVSPAPEEVEAALRVIAEYPTRAAVPIRAGALADGTPVPLLANLGSTDGIEDALNSGAEGVGLFRTEFLFFGSSGAPSVAEQRERYTNLLAAFPGKKIVFRALDAGADKPLSFLNSAHEENPALGLRGIRALRSNERILRDQLSAISLAASVTEAEVWVMAPMVATVEESRYFSAIAAEYDLPMVGVMVEVPSSALMADQILESADFVSIGTNDLTQYTLAADRLLGSVAGFQDPWHPAVLRLIAEVGRAGALHDKPVGVCGEAAADPILAVVLAGLGATSLSMSPAALGDVREELARYSLAEAQEFARVALAASEARQARDAVLAAMRSVS